MAALVGGRVLRFLSWYGNRVKNKPRTSGPHLRRVLLPNSVAQSDRGYVTTLSSSGQIGPMARRVPCDVRRTRTGNFVFSLHCRNFTIVLTPLYVGHLPTIICCCIYLQLTSIHGHLTLVNSDVKLPVNSDCLIPAEIPLPWTQQGAPIQTSCTSSGSTSFRMVDPNASPARVAVWMGQAVTVACGATTVPATIRVPRQ